MRPAKAGQVRAAVRVVLVVGVAADAFLLAGGVLEGDLHRILGAAVAILMIDGAQDVDRECRASSLRLSHVTYSATPPSYRNCARLA